MKLLGKITFWLFFIGFHMTFFIQHFLGLNGVCRVVYLLIFQVKALNTSNLISSLGAFFMSLGVIILLFNVIIHL